MSVEVPTEVKNSSDFSTRGNLTSWYPYESKLDLKWSSTYCQILTSEGVKSLIPLIDFIFDIFKDLS